jgi:hypothetical protein
MGEMNTFTASEGEVKILMDKNPWRFWEAGYLKYYWEVLFCIFYIIKKNKKN